jgi:glycerophosphoryl diester phosphodiesterase
MKRYADKGCYNNISIFENSLKSFEASLKSEFNGIKADIRLIEDGNIVVYCDENLLRMYHIDKQLYNTDYIYLQTVSKNIILLEDVLKFVKEYDIDIILDIKNYNYIVVETIDFFCDLLDINRNKIILLIWNNKLQNNKFTTYLALNNIYNIDILQIKNNKFDGIYIPYKNDYETLQQIIKIKLAKLQVNIYTKRYFLRYIESSFINKFIDKIIY